MGRAPRVWLIYSLYISHSATCLAKQKDFYYNGVISIISVRKNFAWFYLHGFIAFFSREEDNNQIVKCCKTLLGSVILLGVHAEWMDACSIFFLVHTAKLPKVSPSVRVLEKPDVDCSYPNWSSTRYIVSVRSIASYCLLHRTLKGL